MARALLVALACASCAAAVRYGDYAGARMPAYGGGDYDARDAHAQPDDYRGHSPDAPAALDYKFEEDIASHIGKTEPPPVKDTEDTDSWQQRPARKHKKNRPVEDLHIDHAHSFDPDDDFPKPRSSNRFSKHHTRLKSRKYDRPDEELPKYPENHRRSDDSDIEEELQINDFRKDKSKSFEDDRYAHRVATERVVRRKPRDRQMRRKDLDSAELPRGSSEGQRWPLDGLGRAPEPGPLEERVGKQRRPPEEMIASREFPGVDEDDERNPPDNKSKEKQKSYDEYGSDYYDMKRVMNIKKKLPTLLRRPTVPERMSEATPKLSTRSLEDYLLNRRLFLPPQPATRTSTEPPPATTTTTTTTTVTTTTTPAPTTPSASSELSLAEKSRLSILKKAQRKESLYMDASTKKPPVLLQVTKKLPTVVMVEPPSSQKPWMRAQEVFADSPDRLAKVKRLMRHKLVANAKSIHELTDNWDDLVCDYVDMSLLDAPASSRVSRTTLSVVTILFQVILVIR